MTHPDNAIVHFDITGPDDTGLHAFYGDLLGWTVKPMGPGYALVDTPGDLRGAIAEAPAASLALGIQVADLDATLARASELGATVVMPATDNGWVTKAQITDPAGNSLTLIQSAPAE
jgi:hypothetical protein